MSNPSPITHHPSPGAKLPAYAKRLLALRHAGHHPLFVGVIFGDDWAEAKQRALLESAALPYAGAPFKPYGAKWVQMVGFPLIAIAPRDYAPGVFDFRCVAGTTVELHDGANELGDYDSNFYRLGGELSQWAFVSIANGLSMLVEARRAREKLRLAGEDRWPAWWSDDLDMEHGRKFNRWKADAEQCIAAERSAAG